MAGEPRLRGVAATETGRRRSFQAWSSRRRQGDRLDARVHPQLDEVSEVDWVGNGDGRDAESQLPRRDRFSRLAVPARSADPDRDGRNRTAGWGTRTLTGFDSGGIAARRTIMIDKIWPILRRAARALVVCFALAGSQLGAQSTAFACSL